MVFAWTAMYRFTSTINRVLTGNAQHPDCQPTSFAPTFRDSSSPSWTSRRE